MEAPVVTGREFRDADGASTPAVAIVNQTYADQHWPDRSAIGKRLRVIQDQTPGPWMTVVGIVADIMQSPLAQQAIDPLVYTPVSQGPPMSLWVLVRSVVAPAELADPVQDGIVAVDHNLLVWLGPFTLADYVASGYAFNGTVSVLAVLLAGIALFLAVVGVYVVAAQAVGGRTREIGIRVAVGATPREVVTSVLGQDLLALLGGVLLGVAGSVLVNRGLAALLVGVAPLDPMTLGISVSMLMLAVTIGCAVPVRRAIGHDPVVTLSRP
jgi:ABC-type antimicrobial peptide transport system permease subunit